MNLPARFAPPATATAAAATVAAAETTAAATAAGAMAALGPGPCFIYVEGAPAQRLAVESGDGAIGFSAVGHFDEAEPARLAGIAVADQRDLLYGAVVFEQRANGVFGRAEIQITDKDVFHLLPISLR